MNPNQSPIDILWNSLTKFQTTHLLWLAFIIAAIWAIYYLTIIKISPDKVKMSSIVFWFIALLMWCFSYHLFSVEMEEFGFNRGTGLFVFTSLLTVVAACMAVMANSRFWNELTPQLLYSSILFSVFWAIMSGNNKYSITLILGFFLGLISYKLIYNSTIIYRRRNKGEEIEQEETDGVKTNKRTTLK